MTKDVSERDLAVKAAYLSGKSLETVGREFGVTRERIRQLLARQDCLERHGGINEPRRIKVRVADAHRKAAAKVRKARIDRDRADVRALYDAGKTYAEIAEHTGHSIAWVTALIWATGGPDRSPNGGVPRRAPSVIVKLGKRYCKGESVVELAKEFGYANPNVIRQMAYSKGWTRPK